MDGEGTLVWGPKIGGNGIKDTFLILAVPDSSMSGCSTDTAVIAVEYKTVISPDILTLTTTDSICYNEFIAEGGIKIAANRSDLIWSRSGVIIGEDVRFVIIGASEFIEGEWIKAAVKQPTNSVAECFTSADAAIDSVRKFLRSQEDNICKVSPPHEPCQPVNPATMTVSPISVCAGGDVTISINSDLTMFYSPDRIFYHFTYTPANGNVISGYRPNPFVLQNVSVGGWITVDITVPDAECIPSQRLDKKISVVSGAAAPYSVEVNDLITCYADTASISIIMPVNAAGVENYQYSIDNGATWQSSPIFRPVETEKGATYYDIAIKAPTGCVWYDPMSVVVNQIPDSCPPRSPVLLHQDTLVCFGSDVEMSLDIDEPGVVSTWSFEYSADSFLTAGVPVSGVSAPDVQFTTNIGGYYRAVITGKSGDVYYSNIVKISNYPTLPDTVLSIPPICWGDTLALPTLNLDIKDTGIIYTWYELPSMTIVKPDTATSLFKPEL
jgi:hypothetical protein